jgi:aspartyl-tRNA synthetase
MLETSMRTHTCNDLRKKDLDKEIKLCGWVHSRRDHGGLIFIDLRDRFGLTQLCFDPKFNKEAHESADFLRREDCLQIKGEVKGRKEGMTNDKLDTGEVEVYVDNLNVISKSEVPPIEVDDRIELNEDVRLKYRYLDLRKPGMQAKLAIRARAAKSFRDYLTKHEFLEIETPLLVKPTPEGARDYVVPSRVNAGKFYSLPQSPQLYKQLLMVSGFDRYFQLARCLRDEDLRADRQPEHTQVDLEMSFVSEKDLMEFIEGMYCHIVKEVFEKKVGKFSVLDYKESMDKYGNDKPDLRFELELMNVTEIVKESDFQVFKDVIGKNGVVKCLNPGKEMSRKEIDKYIDFCIKEGAKGMAWMKLDNGKLESNIIKFFNEEVQEKLIGATGIKNGYLFFIADKEKNVNSVLSALRIKLGKDLELIKDELRFCWVVDFPLFAHNEDENSWEAEHHIFSMPKEEHLKFLEDDPAKVQGQLFDLVLNGTEIGSGSIRINRPDIQERVMKVIGLSKEEANEKFGFLLKAYEYGGPVHGGMGLGFDRFVALMLGLNDIREVIAFPKNKKAECPMDESPSKIETKQLKELHIKVVE